MIKVLFVYLDNSGESTIKRCFYPYSSLSIHKNQNFQSSLIHYLLLNESMIIENDIIILPGFGVNNVKISKRYELDLFSIIKKYPNKKFIYDIDSYDFNKNNGQPIRFIENCTHVITTCDFLKEKIEEYNKNVNIIESGIDQAFFESCPKAVFDGSKINISWISGDFIGYELFKKIVPIIEDKYQIRVSINTFLPNHFNKYVDNLNSNIIKKYQLNDLQSVFSVLKSTDIVINPIDNNNVAFSILKLFNKKDQECYLKTRTEEIYIDSAIARVPIVSSPSPQYSKYINNSINGFIASDLNEWIAFLSQLIDSAEKRKEVGDMAYRYICENYTFNALANKYENIFL